MENLEPLVINVACFTDPHHPPRRRFEQQLCVSVSYALLAAPRQNQPKNTMIHYYILKSSKHKVINLEMYS